MAPAGKSFRFVRACSALCLDVKNIWDANVMHQPFMGTFIFSLEISSPRPPIQLQLALWIRHSRTGNSMDWNVCAFLLNLASTSDVPRLM